MQDNRGALQLTLQLMDETLARIGFAASRASLRPAALGRETD
jgi:hypothetical protein